MPEPAAEAQPLGAALRRLDPLAWSGLAAAVVAATYPFYWWATAARAALGGLPEPGGDYRYYHAAGRRVLTDPLTLYADPNFLYPPPSGVLFALTARLSVAAGYFLYAALALVALALALRIVERWLPRPLVGWERAAWWTVGFASAPVLQTVKFGQVNTFVLLAALVFLQAVAAPTPRRRALVVGGVALAMGAWLKVYPAVLGALALRRRTLPAAVAAVAASLAIPLLAAPLLPWALYAEFVQEVLPRVTGTLTVGALNGGLPAILERMGRPAADLAVYVPVLPGWAARASPVATLALGGLATLVAWQKGWPTRWAGLALLTLLPVSSTYGWEYTFTLALPAVLCLLAVSRNGPRGARLLALGAALAWLVQKPPESVLRWGIAHLPDAAMDLLAARLVLGLIALSAAAGWTLWLRNELAGGVGARPVPSTGETP